MKLPTDPPWRTPQIPTSTDNPDNKIEQVKRAEGGRYAKGVSGNPGGRPNTSAEVKELIKANTYRAFERLMELMESDDESVALNATKECLNRGLGRVPDQVEFTDKTGERMDLRALTDEQLAQYKQICLAMSKKPS